jgi:hypothetical protein
VAAVRARRSFAAAAAMGGMGCLLCACTLRSLDYLTDGDASVRVDGSPGDAVSDTRVDDGADVLIEASSSDAGGDSSMTDVATTDQSAGDAISDAVVADADASMTGTWCQLQPPALLCLDFDEGSLTAAYSDGGAIVIPAPNADNGSTASLGTPAASSPGAFVANVGALSAGNNVACEYILPLQAGTVSTVHLQFDMELVTYSTANEIDFATLYMPPPDGGAAYRTYVSVNSSQARLYSDQGNSANFSLPGPGAFHNYRLDLSLSGTLTFRLYIDDPNATGAPAAQLSEPAPFGATPGASFILGTNVYGTSAAVQANFDNVVFNGQ